MNFGNIFGGIGDFFGGIFGGKDKKEEEKKPQVNTPTVTRPKQRSQPVGGIQMPQAFIDNAQPNTRPPELGGVKIRGPVAGPSAAQTPPDGSVDEFNKLDLGGQRSYRSDLSDSRKGVNVGTKSGVAELDRINSLLSQIDDEEVGKKKAGNFGTFLQDAFGGMQDLVGESDIKKVFNSVDKIKALQGGAPVGALQTVQDIESANQSYKDNQISYDDLLRSFRNSPGAFSADSNFTISKSGGIENIQGDVLKQSKDFLQGVGSAGTTAAQFLPVGFTSQAPALLARYGSRFAQGAGFNAGMVALERLVNPASNKSLEATAQEAVLSGIFGGLLDGFGGGGRPVPPAVSKASKEAISSELKQLNPAMKNSDEIANEIVKQAENPQPKADAPREPSSPITSSPTTNKAPAVTSANPDFVPTPTVEPPKPFDFGQAPVNQPPALGGVPPLRAAAPEVPVAPVKTVDDQLEEVKQLIDEVAAEQPTPAPVPVSQVAEAPSKTQARAIANDTPPVNRQAVEQAVEAQRVADAPTEAIADGVPVLKSYGRDIPMTEKNGYVATKTPDGGTVYEKMSKVGSNRKGDTSFETRYYDDTGFKLTKAQHAARVSGQLPTAPKTATQPTKATIAPTKLDLGDAGKQVDEIFGKTSAKAEPEPAPELPPVTNLGRIAQDAVQSGEKLDDAGWESLAGTVGRASEARAKELGTSVESIMEKVQLAADSRGKIKTVKQAGLTADEFDLYTNMTNELTYLRNRADPSLITGGTIDSFYAPRQLTDTEFDPRLVNEEVRGGGGNRLKATDSDLDLTTVPFEQYIRRYGDANSVIKQSAFNTVEQMPVKLKGGGEELVDSGVKVSDGAKARFEVQSKKYVEKKDAIEQELAKGDFSVKQIDDLTQQMDDDINLAFKELMDDMPKDTAAGREAIARLTSQRGAYLQSSVRSNMFSNIVNRVFDQTGKALVQSTNQAMGVADSLVAAGLRTSRTLLKRGDASATSKALSKGADARSVAREYATGALGKKLKQDFRTNMAFAGNSKLAKADVAYRAGSTALTSFGDLTTTTVKLANRAMLARAQAQGITSKAGMREYLRKNINGAEYRELLTGIQDTYAGYVSLPMSSGSRIGRTGKRLSKIDNFIANNEALKNLGVPQRARRELNDAIMPWLSGFAGATYRIGAKSLNASALGLPNMYRGLKLAREGGESARQIGQIMIARSLIDGVVGGTASASVIGTLLAENAEWTGSYPTGDKNEAARWEKDGIVPNAFSFDLGNGQKFQIQPGRVVGPFALPVVLPAVIASGGDLGEVFDGTLGQMLQNLGVDGAIQNAGTIATALTGSGYQKEAAIEKFLRSAAFGASSLVPISGLQNNIANALDDTKRQTSGFVDSVLARNPLTRPSLPEKTDNFGNPVRNNTQGSLGSQAGTTSNSGSNSGASVDPVNDEVNRLAKLGSEVTPGSDVKNPGGLDDAKVLLESKLYQGADDEKKAEYLKETLLGTQTKDINSSLSPEKRSALIEHKLQTEDQRKVWLEDNDNAANYFQGNYDNKKANKVLSQQDDNLQTKSGAKYLAIRAGVNQKYNADTALQNLYEDVTESEWRDMLDPDSGDADLETAERLYAYDQARTKAGVSGRGSDSSKPKYELKGAGKGKGGKGSTKFGFASLPSSLIGTGSSGGSGYAKAAPLFKPIADLKAPATVAIPKGRNISVKRGARP